MRRGHRAAHRWIWIAVATLLPVLVIAAIAIRPSGPAEAPPVRLEPPSNAP